MQYDPSFAALLQLQPPRPVADELSSLANFEEIGAGETNVPARVGSPGALDQLTSLVELGAGDGAAGFVGKTSEISWLHRVRTQLFERHPSQHTRPAHPANLNTTPELDYHMEDANLLLINEDVVDALRWPQHDLAERLSRACFASLDGVFSFLDEKEFFKTLAAFPRGTQIISWAHRRFLGMANVVFAIGVRRLATADILSHGDFAGSEDHLVYYARARALGVDHRMLFDHPLFQQVQALGLLAVYLLVNNSVAR